MTRDDRDATVARLRAWANALCDLGGCAGHLAHHAAALAEAALDAGDLHGYGAAMTILGELQLRLADIRHLVPLLDDQQDPKETLH